MRYHYQAGVIVPFAQKHYKQLILAVAAIFMSSMAVMSLSAKAATSDVNDLSDPDWVLFERDSGNAELSDEFGAPAGLGTSALKLTTPLSNDKANFKNITFAGQDLDSIETLSYHTYRSSASTPAALAAQAPAINMEVDANGLETAGGYTTLVFEPVYQTGGAGAIANDTWQQWDAGDATIWWSSNAIPGAPNRDTFVTLASLKAANPDAVVLSVGVNQGGGNTGLIGAVDGLTVNDSVFNFEIAADTVSTPEITSPSNGATLTTDELTEIDWTDSVASNSTAVTYQYQAYSDAAYTALVYSSGDLSDSEIPTPGTPEGTYYVRVQAKDAEGNLSEWSNGADSPYVITVDNPVVLGSKDECKNGGWATSEAPVFKNQGQCVSHFASEGRSTSARNR